MPYNNFALNNSFICDGYLPEIVLFVLACLILVINPALRLIKPSLSVSHRNMALLVGILLFAAVIPSNGLFRFFPHCLAYDVVAINEAPEVAEAIKNSDLPPALFPDEIGKEIPTPISQQLVEELDQNPDNWWKAWFVIPWKAWLRPLVSWGTLIVAYWALMLGLGAMIYPQWRKNERVVFPLLRVYHSLIDEPEEGSLVPPVLRSKFFWLGCGLVILIHSTAGLALMTDNGFPEFPVTWDISRVFSDGVWVHAPGFLKRSRIYFLFVGLAYFMPSRHSFSIWFTVLLAGLFVMTSRTYMPTFNFMHLYDMGCGALIIVAAVIIWLGRHHYARVAKASVFIHSGSPEDKTNAFVGRVFMFAAIVMFGWYIWAGAGVFWSILFVAVGIIVMLLVSRIVAETGITYVWIIPLTAARLTSLFPKSWTTTASAFLQEANYILFNRATAVSAAAMMMLTLGLNRKPSAKAGRNWIFVGLTVLVLGLLIGGAIHLHMGYTMETSFDAVQTPITGRGARIMSLGPVTDLAMGRDTSIKDRGKFIAFGAVIACVLLFLCYRFPGWPLHPIGMIFVHSSIGLRLCISLCLGWALRTFILHYFGARAYKAAMPLFLGFILGEMFANIIWILIPVLEILFGTNPGEIKHMIIFQYT